MPEIEPILYLISCILYLSAQYKKDTAYKAVSRGKR